MITWSGGMSVPAQNWQPLGSGLKFDGGGTITLFTDTVDNILYAGGNILEADNIPVNFIAKWDGVKWDSVGSGLTAYVRGITRFGSDIYIGDDLGVQKWN